MLLQDFNKTEEINPFSEESKDLITDMGDTEIFELYETSTMPGWYWHNEIAVQSSECQSGGKFKQVRTNGRSKWWLSWR